jgi:chromosome segregation ATPase
MTGCGDPSLEQETLVEMSVKLQKNSARIEELSLGLDGVNARLAAIEGSLLKLASPSSPTEKSPSGLAGPASGASADMESLSKQVAVLMEELAATNEELESAKGAMEKIAVKASEPRDIGKAVYNVARDPQRFVEGIDKLVERVSPRIEDAATRQNFEAKMAQLRDRVLNPTSTEELYQELHSLHIQKLNAVTDENDRRAIEQRVSWLENCSEQELQNALANYESRRTLGEFWGIVKNESYEVRFPEDLVQTWFANPNQK